MVVRAAKGAQTRALGAAAAARSASSSQGPRDAAQDGPNGQEGPRGPRPPQAPQAPQGPHATRKPLSAAKQKLLEQKQQKEKFRLQHNYPFKRDGRPMLKEGMQSLADRNCIFISVDLEMFEFATNTITEIGIATFELGPDAPLFPNIQAYHLMPLETVNKINSKIMANKRHLFVHGDSYTMPMAECRLFWAQLLERYAAKAKADNKKLYLVGHDVQGDLTCLSVNRFEFDRSLPVLDTLLIWEATCSSSPGLGSVLERLQIPAKFLHNAGNDAVATLRLLLAELDPQVRLAYKLDEGPSAAEANAALKAANQAARLEKEKQAKTGAEGAQLENGSAPGSTPEVAPGSAHEPAPDTRKKTPAEIKAFKAEKLQRDRERTKKRLAEMHQDKPGKVESANWRDLLDKIIV